MDENHQNKSGSTQTAVEDGTRGVQQEKSTAVPKRKTGFEEKTLWDKLNLFGTLAIPLIIALASIGFGLLQLHLADVQHQQDQQSAALQHQQDQANILDQQRAAILQTYIDNVQDLLLNHNLLKSKPDDDVAILARARTLIALQGLNAERKGRLLIFLNEATLIGFMDTKLKIHDTILNLSAANLNGANLEYAELNGANLSEADLNGASLHSVRLIGADLNLVNLNGADLTQAFLNGADLSRANLRGADLNFASLVKTNLSSAFLLNANLSSALLWGANLEYAELNGANLSYADFNGANLKGVDLSGANLSHAFNLTQQLLDQVFSCKGAILPKGLICHNYQYTN